MNIAFKDENNDYCSIGVYTHQSITSTEAMITVSIHRGHMTMFLKESDKLRDVANRMIEVANEMDANNQNTRTND